MSKSISTKTENIDKFNIYYHSRIISISFALFLIILGLLINKFYPEYLNSFITFFLGLALFFVSLKVLITRKINFTKFLAAREIYVIKLSGIPAIASGAIFLIISLFLIYSGVKIFM